MNIQDAVSELNITIMNFDGDYPKVWCPSHPRSHHGLINLHRLLMEIKLNRFLDTDEIVHHEDEDKFNFDLDNLILIQGNGAHVKLHAKPVTTFNVSCAWCGLEFTKPKKAITAFVRKNRKRHFCSRSCNSKHNIYTNETWKHSPRTQVRETRED